MPRYAFWIDDTRQVVSELENPPSEGDVLELTEGSQYIVTIERPNHDGTVEAAYTVEPAAD